jgi:hypothetical protein
VVRPCWAESVIGADYTFDASKTDAVDYYLTSDSNTIAFALNFGGRAYIIKNATFWILMENVASLDWGILDS